MNIDPDIAKREHKALLRIAKLVDKIENEPFPIEGSSKELAYLAKLGLASGISRIINKCYAP